MSHNSEFHEALRIVIVGMPETGKSSTGDTILGKECFTSDFLHDVTPRCSKGSAVVDGQQILVVDTPDRFILSEMAIDLPECVGLSVPGPHVFLVVSRLDRVNEGEKQLMQDMKEKFSPDVDRYCMVLFTGGDQLEDTMEELLDRSPGHQDLVAQCYNRYHVFDNKQRGKDRSQVTELLHKVKNMVQENGGYYTNEKFQEEMRKMEEEKQLRQAEEEEERGGQRAEQPCNIM